MGEKKGPQASVVAMAQPFTADDLGVQDLPVIAADLGSSRRSCRLAWSGSPKPCQESFGGALAKVANLLVSQPGSALVVEAPLSTCHSLNGNPRLRGEFEIRRGWYWGAGVVATLAARRLLTLLAAQLRVATPILVAEAFLSNKSDVTRHRDHAHLIAKQSRTRQ